MNRNEIECVDKVSTYQYREKELSKRLQEKELELNEVYIHVCV